MMTETKTVCSSKEYVKRLTGGDRLGLSNVHVNGDSTAPLYLMAIERKQSKGSIFSLSHITGTVFSVPVVIKVQEYLQSVRTIRLTGCMFDNGLQITGNGLSKIALGMDDCRVQGDLIIGQPGKGSVASLELGYHPGKSTTWDAYGQVTYVPISAEPEGKKTMFDIENLYLNGGYRAVSLGPNVKIGTCHISAQTYLDCWGMSINQGAQIARVLVEGETESPNYTAAMMLQSPSTDADGVLQSHLVGGGADNAFTAPHCHIWPSNYPSPRGARWHRLP